VTMGDSSPAVTATMASSNSPRPSSTLPCLTRAWPCSCTASARERLVGSHPRPPRVGLTAPSQFVDGIHHGYSKRSGAVSRPSAHPKEGPGPRRFLQPVSNGAPDPCALLARLVWSGESPPPASSKDRSTLTRSIRLPRNPTNHVPWSQL